MASICRFYPAYRLEHVGRLTFKEFFTLNRNMIKIAKMENPQPEEEKAIEGTAKNLRNAGLVKSKKKKRK